MLFIKLVPRESSFDTYFLSLLLSIYGASLCPSLCVQSTRAMEQMLETPESRKVSTGQNSMMVER